MIDRLGTSLRSLGPLFLICVVMPTLVATIYYSLVASDVYVSESSFIVHATDRKVPSGIGALFQGGSIGGASEEAHAVHEYIDSRDALRQLNNQGFVRKIYTRPNIDWVDRFGGSIFDSTFEGLWRYFKRRVTSDLDSTSSMMTLQVRAYTARDAQEVAQRLIQQSEDLVNQINERSRQDMITFALRDVSDARLKARSAAVALASYRQKQGVVDPEKQAGTELQFIAKLQDQLLTVRSQLAQLQAFTPQNPQIAFLKKQIVSLESEIAAENGKVTGSEGSLASAAAGYQRVLLDSQFADKLLISVMASLEEARSDARRKQAYIEVVVSPNLPDTAIEPRRMRGIFATFVLGLIAWGVATMLLAGLNEHQD
jgi:capsular polysaccharide transport system permease protein